MTGRLGGFRRRGFPVLASLSLVTTLACGGAITGCNGDDNGGGTGEEDGGEDAALADGATPVADSGTDAAKDAAADGAKDGAAEATTNEAGAADTGLKDTGADSTVDSGDSGPTTIVDSGPDSTTDAGDGGPTIPVALIPGTTLNVGLGDCGGAAVSTTVPVKNTGGGTLTVGASLIGTVFTVTPTSLSLTAGQSGSFTISATVPANSVAGSALTGSLVVTTNDATHLTTTVPLTATAHGVTLAWATGSPTDADFGVATNAVADSPIGLTLTNTGNAPATNVTLGAPTNSQFTLTPTSVATLASGATTALSAGFTPNTLSVSGGTSAISFTGPACGTSISSLTFSGQGGIGAVTGWPSASVDFGGGNCGGAAPAQQSFTLSNSGGVPAHIASVTESGTAGYTSSVAAGAIIAAGGTLLVTLTPPAIPSVSAVPGSYAASFTFTTDVIGDNSHIVNVLEHAVGAILTFDPSPTGPNFGAFGPVPDGNPSSQNFNVVNSGNLAADVTLTTTTPFSVSNAVFNVVGDSSQPFADTATFTPTQPAGASALLSITTTSVTCQALPSALSLTGTGEGGGVLIPTQSLAFAANCGTAAMPKSFTIQNTGNQPMTWTAGGFNTDLYTLSDTGPTLVDPGATSTILVTPASIAQFPINTSPTAFGSSISISTDVVGDTPHTVTLSETPLGDILSLTSSPSPLDFGQAPIGTVSQGPTFTVANAANAGSVPAQVAVLLGGDDSDNFSLAASLEVVQPGSLGTAEGISFNSPGSPGPNSASLQIGTDDVLCAPLPNPIAITAVATAAGPFVTPSALAFGDENHNVNCGATAGAQSVTVTNTGDLSFHITSATTNNAIYTVTMNSIDGTVTPTGSVTITVTPGAIPANVAVVPSTSTFSGILTIATDADEVDNPNPTFTIPLTMGAKGVIISNQLSTTTWAFTQNGLLVPVGNSSSITIPIHNSGNESAQVSLVNLNPVFSLTALAAAGVTTELTPTFQPTQPSTTSTDTGEVIVLPTEGNVFCQPLPSTWGTVASPATVNLSGSSAAALP